jgi:hypothetical protein
LLPAAFGLARLLPRSYERIAADTGAAALWELVLVRAYLHAGRAIAAPMPRLQRAAAGARSQLFVSGVLGPSLRLGVDPLLPRVVADHRIAAPNDELGVMPRLVARLLAEPADPAARSLAAAAHSYLASPNLFSGPGVAGQAAAAAHHYVDVLLDDVRRRGCQVIEVDGQQVVLGVPTGWDAQAEREVAEAARAYLPDGVRLHVIERYAALYARAPGTSIRLAHDGAITLIGPAFRAGRLERFGERFMQRAAECVLRGDAVRLREVFVETVHLLRTRQIALDDLCVQVTLHKSPQQYRRGGTHEEPYEVLLAAGVRSWRVGQRIRYFRARGNEPRLLREGDSASPGEADAEYYVQRLCGLYCQQFAQAFRREDFATIFRVPSGDGPFDEPEVAGRLAEVTPILTPLA